MLLIDEVDRVEIETEALLLEVLSDFQVSIPELGHDRRRATAARLPHVEQHPRAVRGAEAPLPVPAYRLSRHRTREGDRAGPGPGDRRRARRTDRPSCAAPSANIDLKKAPSISETIDWARTLLYPRPSRDHARGDRRDLARPAQVPVRHHQGPQGARRRRARHSGTSLRADAVEQARLRDADPSAQR